MAKELSDIRIQLTLCLRCVYLQHGGVVLGSVQWRIRDCIPCIVFHRPRSYSIKRSREKKQLWIYTYIHTYIHDTYIHIYMRHFRPTCKNVVDGCRMLMIGLFITHSTLACWLCVERRGGGNRTTYGRLAEIQLDSRCRGLDGASASLQLRWREGCAKAPRQIGPFASCRTRDQLFMRCSLEKSTASPTASRVEAHPQPDADSINYQRARFAESSLHVRWCWISLSGERQKL